MMITFETFWEKECAKNEISNKQLELKRRPSGIHPREKGNVVLNNVYLFQLDIVIGNLDWCAQAQSTYCFSVKN